MKTISQTKIAFLEFDIETELKKIEKYREEYALIALKINKANERIKEKQKEIKEIKTGERCL